MLMGKIRTLLLLCILIISTQLFAQITATWVPQPVLQFGPVPSPMDTSKFGLHLGTLTINVQGNQLFDPNIIHLDFTSALTVTGPMTWHNDAAGNPVYSVQESGFRLVAVSTNRGVTEVVNIDQTDGSSRIRTEGGNLNTSSLVVQLYILSYQDWIRYKPGAFYEITSGSMISFGVGVAENGSTYDNRGYRISVNGASPTATTSFFAPGNSLSTPVPYGTPDTQIQYLFNIIDEQNFSIANAYGSNKSRVARTRLEPSNTIATKPYTFQIIFRNQSNSRYFSLQLEGHPTSRTIPYVLEFNSQRVYGGEALTWIVQGNIAHIKDIFVTQINSLEAENAVSGIYRDTISVEIIPPDTI